MSYQEQYMQFKMPARESFLERIQRDIDRNREIILKDIFRQRQEQQEQAAWLAEKDRQMRLTNICKPLPAPTAVPEPIAPIIPPVPEPLPLPPIPKGRFNKNDF